MHRQPCVATFCIVSACAQAAALQLTCHQRKPSTQRMGEQYSTQLKSQCDRISTHNCSNDIMFGTNCSAIDRRSTQTGGHMLRNHKPSHHVCYIVWLTAPPTNHDSKEQLSDLVLCVSPRTCVKTKKHPHEEFNFTITFCAFRQGLASET